jgi:Spy/CpxP family protein refolding chaperone
MPRFLTFIALAGTALLLSLPGLATYSQEPTKTEKKEDTSAIGSVRGQLPPLWKKLGLSEQQVQRIYAIQAKYRGQIQALQRQMKALREQEQREMQEVLTVEQRRQLQRLLAERAGVEGTPSEKDKK